MCLLLHTFWNCDALNYILVLNDPADVLGHFWPQKNQPKKETCYYYILMCSVFNFLQQHVILCTYSYVQSITNVPNTWKSFNCTNYSWGGGLKNILVPPHMEQPYSWSKCSLLHPRKREPQLPWLPCQLHLHFEVLQICCLKPQLPRTLQTGYQRRQNLQQHLQL